MNNKEKSEEQMTQGSPPVGESAESERDSQQQSDSLEQLYEQARHHAEQLETLSVIESALSETDTEAEMLDVFVLAVRDTAHLTAWLLYAGVDPEAATSNDDASSSALTAQIVASWHDGSIQSDDPLLNQPLTPDLVPLARLWMEDPGEIFYVPDIQQATEVDADLREWATARGTHTLMMLPMLSGGRLQGVVVLQWAEPYPLSATEQFVLRRLLRPTVALLARRRAYLSEEAARAENALRAAQFQTAAEVARAASSIIDLNELLPQAVELVRERFDLYYIGIFLVDETGEWVALRAGSGEAGRIMLENKHGFVVGGDSMIGRCVAEARAQLPERVEAAVRYVNPLLPDTTAEIALPLISRNQMIGAMSVQSSKIRTFSETDITILQTVADQLANAIQNARLFEQLNTSLTESEMQTEVSVAINEAQSIEEITRAAAHVGDFIGMEGVTLRYFTHWDADGTPLVQDVYGIIAQDGEPEFRQQNGIEVDQELLEWFFSDAQQSRRMQTPGALSFVKDLSIETDVPEKLRQNLIQQGYQSLIMAPLEARNRLLGFLTLYSENPVEDLPERYAQVFVRTLVDEVTTGLDRYILLHESERRAGQMETALEVSRHAASMLDEEALLAEVAELIRERFGFYYVGIFMLDDSEQWAVLDAGTGDAGRAMMTQGHRLQAGGNSMIG
ncbi:MAG: GAF domain-containing protein, partial [Anaerolineae bacterium]